MHKITDIIILYVEDAQGTRDGLSDVLKYFCTKLFTACNGKEGLKLFKENKPDIVISDIKMPIMNGIEMVKAIKKINIQQHIIFTTAHSENSYFIEAIDLQVDGYILKPVDLDKLEEKINSIKEIIKLKQDFKEQQIIINEIAKFQNNILVVLNDKKKPIFSNNMFLNFMSLDNLDQFNSKYKCLADIFIKNNDFFYPSLDINSSWIDELQNIDDKKRVVSINDIKTSNEKAFLVSIKFMSDTSHTILIFTEITNLTIEKKEFEHKAYTDELTKIHNRTYFNEELKREILNHKIKDTSLCLILLDIDFFKKINDKYGHQIGDDILIELTSIMKIELRITDTIARWGGEEFVIILPNTTLENAKIVAENFRIKIQNHTFKNNLNVTCSFGISKFYKDDLSENLLKKADRALYKAKENGRNRVES